MRAAALVLCAAVLAAGAASSAAAAAAVESGTIAVNRGAVGVRLGMKRSPVVDKLGRPVYENANGYMQYASTNLFDVYLGGRNRVRLIGVSGRHFCTRSGICMWTKNGVKRLKARFGDRLKALTLDDGEPVYVVRGHYKGRRVFSSFSVPRHRPRAKITQIFIGRCPPKPAVCGL